MVIMFLSFLFSGLHYKTVYNIYIKYMVILPLMLLIRFPINGRLLVKFEGVKCYTLVFDCMKV